MPHNYIFGQEFSHHGVGSQLDGRFVGQTNCINGVGMKRKEAWLGLAAGNFELQKEDGGPTCEKRVKVSPDSGEEMCDISDSTGNLAANVPHENSPQICHSMVAHMAVSYRNQNQQVSDEFENIGQTIKLAENQVPYDVDMECAVSMDDVAALVPTVNHTEDVYWHRWCSNVPRCDVDSTGNWQEEIASCFHGS